MRPQYEPGDLLQFHQNAPGYKKGSRLIVGEGVKPPTELANRFEVYRPTQFALAVGDRMRVTAGGKTKDGKHRLSNGSLATVQGFTKRGDIIVDHGWVIDRDFGHLTPRICRHQPCQPGRDRGQGLRRHVQRIVPGDLPADGLCGADTRARSRRRFSQTTGTSCSRRSAGRTIRCRRRSFPSRRSRTRHCRSADEASGLQWRLSRV